MTFRKFAQVTAYLARFTDYERMTGGRYAGQPYTLRRMERLLDALGRPERGFETTLGKNGAIKTAAIVGGGGMMDVIGQIKEGDSKIKLYGYCEFEGPLTKKAGS